MKKTLLTLAVLATAASVFAQGTVMFTGLNSANGVNWKVFQADGTTALSGANYFAQLLSSPGLDQSAGFVAGTPTTTFRTGSGAGYIALTTVTLANVAKDSTGGATVMAVAWDNTSGLYPTWAEAGVAWQEGKIAAGMGPWLNVSAKIGGDLTTPPFLTGMQGFNISIVPEPSSLALAGLGAAAMLIFRRRK